MNLCWGWFLVTLILILNHVVSQKGDTRKEQESGKNIGGVESKKGQIDNGTAKSKWYNIKHAKQQIVRGKPSSLDHCSHMAAIFSKIKETGEIKFSCGGSILDKHTILTAGHCCKDEEDEKEPYEVKVGCEKSIRWKNMKQKIKIKKFVTHPDFKRKEYQNKINDLCLMRLEKKIKDLNKENEDGHTSVKSLKLPGPGDGGEAYDGKALK